MLHTINWLKYSFVYIYFILILHDAGPADITQFGLLHCGRGFKIFDEKTVVEFF